MSHHSQLEWATQRLLLILHWTHMWLISRFRRQRAAASIIFSWQAVRPTCHQQLMWGILMLMPVCVSLDKMADQLWGRTPGPVIWTKSTCFLGVFLGDGWVSVSEFYFTGVFIIMKSFTWGGPSGKQLTGPVAAPECSLTIHLPIIDTLIGPKMTANHSWLRMILAVFGGFFFLIVTLCQSTSLPIGGAIQSRCWRINTLKLWD